MLKEKKIKIAITNRNITRMRGLGYDVSDKTLEISVEDLSTNSREIVTALCGCGSETPVMYGKYLQNVARGGFYGCKKCSRIKAEKTSIEKYGAVNYMSTDAGKETVKNNNLRKYGVTSTGKLDSVRKKMKNTMIERYGVDQAMKSEKIRSKAIETNIEKYGVPYYNRTLMFKDSMNEKWFLERDEFMSKTGLKYRLDKTSKSIFIKCDRCSKEFETTSQLLYHRKLYKTDICTFCNPIGVSFSGKEMMFADDVKAIYPGKVLTGYRLPGSRKSVDVYLPDLKVAFEFNGLRWHSEDFVHSNYHASKTKECFDAGIKLIHIWEDEYDKKPEQVLNFIRSCLGVNSKKIHARKCVIKPVSGSDSKRFCVSNHLQGWAPASTNLGLYYEDELVMLCTFSRCRKIYGGSKGDLELVRMCTLGGSSVVGGASKIMREALRIFPDSKIFTFADAMKGDGNVYKKIGFDYIGTTKPGYWYAKKLDRLHRFALRKDVLVRMGGDPTKTERELAKQFGYSRLWDCGQHKFVLGNDCQKCGGAI